MSVTIDEVAERVQLHKTSVSRIFNGKGDNFSATTRQRVLETAAAMGYQPNPNARALATGATQMVALWLLSSEYYSPYYGYIHHYLQQIGVANGYQIITEDIPDSHTGADELPDFSQLMAWPVDGIIACDVPSVTAGFMRSKQKKRTPIVTISVESDALSDYILLDAYTGAKEAVQHLVTAGCCRIAFATFERPNPRTNAYLDVMQATGKAPELIVTQNDSRLAGYEAMRAYVGEHGCPDGLFCFNDEIAIGCQVALHELGIRVPHDLLLVGFDGLENARLSTCPLSTVVVPIEEMCRLAWEFLMKRLQEPDAPFQQVQLVPRLQIRASSRG